MGIVTVEKLENADKDADSLEKFISGSDTENVKTRKAKEYPTLANAVRQVIETGGFEPFSTEVELLASTPTLNKKAAKALDTKKVWLWDGTQWNDTGLSEYDLANNERKDLIDGDGYAGSLLLTGEQGIAFGEINNEKIEIIDFIEIVKEGDGFEVAGEYGLVISFISDDEVTTPTNTAKPLFSKQLCGFSDGTLKVYVSQMFADSINQKQLNDVIANIASTDAALANAYIETSRDCLKIETSKLKSTAQLALRNINNSTSTTTLDLSVVNVQKQTSKAINILQIGDSITNRTSGTIVRQALESHGFTPNFIGTLKGAKYQTSVINAADGENGEGREGWQTGDFTNAIVRQAVTSESDYLSKTQLEKRSTYNPFLRASTSSDDASIVKNGYVFDLEYYLSRFSYQVPNVVVIALGVNDLLSNNLTEIYNNYVLMINQCLKVANTKIVVTVPSVSFLRTEWAERSETLIREIQRAVNTVNSSRVMLAPAWTFAPHDVGFSLASTRVTDTISGAITASYEDPTHPINANAYSIWEGISAYIAASAI